MWHLIQLAVVVETAPGAARLVLADNVAPLDPEPAVLEAMLSGWARQQRARFLREQGTIVPRLALVQRLVAFSGLYPWQWTPAEYEAWVDHLRSGSRPLAVSTARNYEVVLRLFCEYLLAPSSGWVAVCTERFGQAPQQVVHEWNSVIHRSEYEGRPSRRPLSYDEVQALFDAADALPAAIRGRGRKGALSALRDAALLKTVYAFGLRRQEATRLDLVDLRRHAKAPQHGRAGAVHVRYGKASRGGAPRRRTVLLVPEMDWVVGVLEHWIGEVRPALSPGAHPALWVTERRGRVSTRSANEAFIAARDAAGLAPELDLHCLRHSYITHLIEFGYPERFVQEQAGHAYAATTAVYAGVSDDYRNRLLARALRGRHPEMWDDQP